MEHPQKNGGGAPKKNGAAAGKKMLGGTGEAEAAPEPPEQGLKGAPRVFWEHSTYRFKALNSQPKPIWCEGVSVRRFFLLEQFFSQLNNRLIILKSRNRFVQFLSLLC